MNAYEQKQLERRERLINAAAKARVNASQKQERVTGILSLISPGQPILLGHHSQRRHEKDLKRVDTAMRQSFEELERAKELEARAESVGSGGISSDDPQALEKLKAKLEKLATLHARNLRINKALLKNDQATLTELEYTESRGIPHWFFSSSSAEQRRIKQRIEQLEKLATREAKTQVFRGVEFIESPEENRLKLKFEGKPDPEIIKELKSHGFRWTPSQGVWQRQLNNRAIWAANQIIQKLPKD